MRIYPVLTGLTVFSLTTLAASGFSQEKIFAQPTLQAEAEKPCPLPDNIAVTFLNSKCKAVKLSQPTTYYRYYSTDQNKFGRYLTTDLYQKNTDVIRKLALNQAWGNRATILLKVTVPAGTMVYQGIVAPQTPASCYPGGGQQTFIENSKDPNLKWFDDTPMQVESFQCPEQATK